jgi:hypothetical protein
MLLTSVNFVCSLFNDAHINPNCMASNDWTNVTGYGIKRQWPNFGHYPSLECLRKFPSHDTLYPGRGSNRVLPEYKLEQLPLEPT